MWLVCRSKENAPGVNSVGLSEPHTKWWIRSSLIHQNNVYTYTARSVPGCSLSIPNTLPDTFCAMPSSRKDEALPPNCVRGPGRLTGLDLSHCQRSAERNSACKNIEGRDAPQNKPNAHEASGRQNLFRGTHPGSHKRASDYTQTPHRAYV